MNEDYQFMVDLIHEQMNKAREQRNKHDPDRETASWNYYQGIVQGYSQAALIVMNSVPLNPQDH